MTLELLKKSLLEAPVMKRGNYSYFIHPITDGVPELKPELLEEVVNEMKKRIEKCGKIDKIITIEALGVPLATALCLKMNIPFVIIRKRPYGLPNEIVIEQETGYSKSKLYVNDVKKSDKVVIVDDVLSTGGTLKGVLSALNKIGADIKGVFIAINKGNSLEDIKNKYNIKIDILANVEIINDKIIIKKI
jgi:adenine phosphoribosyltransferase